MQRLIGIALAFGVTTGSVPSLHRINQTGKQFSAAQIRIAAGDSIVFVNNDAVMHNVFSTSTGFKFNLKSQPPGAKRVVPFKHPGTAMIRCAFHPTMRLTVIVE